MFYLTAPHNYIAMNCSKLNIFTLELPVAEKEKILREEFGMKMDDDMKRRLSNMRNLEQRVF